jgi:VacB/RNase II family 3'-5' exoribonuclease
MANRSERRHSVILQEIARRAMLERGLLPDFSAEARAELSGIEVPLSNHNHARDLRDRLWASIDNEDSLDLDQLTFAEAMPGGEVKVFVAIADVDAIVKNDSAIDSHARHNTTSVYTPSRIFPMLPEELSTDLTSLSFAQDRLAVVVEMTIGQDGSPGDSDIYQAWVHNRAKLDYNSVGLWLEGGGDAPAAIAVVKGLDENLRTQDRTAQLMKTFRHAHGSLGFETVEARPVFYGDEIREFRVERRNRARDLVEGFMIAVNSTTARYLSSRNLPFLQRVVKAPRRWSRIVELAAEHGFELSPVPDPKELERFLMKEKAENPLEFPDLSLSVIKLLGPGEYVAELPGDPLPSGHFGLAVRGYAHSTAPNRRYPDLITQRILKTALSGESLPYSADELEALARHCTLQEDAARKVERQVGKSAAALFLESRIGEVFDAIVMGAAPKGTWVRLSAPPVEGRLVRGFENIDVGMRVRVQLRSVDVDHGFIDFERPQA